MRAPGRSESESESESERERERESLASEIKRVPAEREREP